MRRLSVALGMLLTLGALATASAQEETFETIDPTSQAMLAREPVTELAEVKHILIGWAELAQDSGRDADPRAAQRSREQADSLARALLVQVRAGDPIEQLMAEYSEDPGSATTGESYTATPDAGLVEPFKALSLRLEVGEAGLVLTNFGWHIIKRVS